MSFHVPNKFRIRAGLLGSDDSHKNCGAFAIRDGLKLYAIASTDDGWEHVSVSSPTGATPTWDEMCKIKAMFWDDEDCVVQYHPPRSRYVNVHSGCLHLWRPIDGEFPMPPKDVV